MADYFRICGPVLNSASESAAGKRLRANRSFESGISFPVFARIRIRGLDSTIVAAPPLEIEKLSLEIQTQIESESPFCNS
jgi:hypothetical protein